MTPYIPDGIPRRHLFLKMFFQMKGSVNCTVLKEYAPDNGSAAGIIAQSRIGIASHVRDLAV